MPEMERSVVEAQVKRTHLTRLRPINEPKAGTEGTEGTITGDESEAGSERMGSDEHVHGRKGTTVLPRGSPPVPSMHTEKARGLAALEGFEFLEGARPVRSQ